MTYNTAQLNLLIRNRRSVWPHQYDINRKVPKYIIEQMLENANWAPTHGLTEPWRFRVYSGEGLKKLMQYQADVYKEKSSPEDYKEAKYQKTIGKAEQSSYVIAIIMKRCDTAKIPEIEEVEAVSCAVQNMYLTATAYGAGAYWSSGGVTYKEDCKDYFDLEEEDKLLGFMFVGYPVEKPTKGRRKPIAEKVVWLEG